MTAATAGKRHFKGLALVGGHPALDLLNSVKYRGRADPMDTLRSYNDVVDWVELVQVIDGHEAETLRGLAAEDPETSGAIFRDICIFRENLRCVLDPG
ncbi:MAG: ABATE domain-containing protein, partial [Proteobacteria bacterium]|nr:ABATE domain-containing protein [Pseudomonadota bacterium]